MVEQIEAATPVVSTPLTFDLGSHVLEVLEDQSVLITDQSAEKETVQLDQEESYRLLVVLQSVFTAEPFV